MFASIARALFVTAALAIAAAPLGAAGQTAAPTPPKVTIPAQPKPPTAQKANPKYPGRTCAELTPNTPAHKDCIAKQTNVNQQKSEASKAQAHRAARKPAKKPGDQSKS